MASGPLSPIVPPQRPQQPRTQWSNKSVAVMIFGAVATLISVMVIVSRLNRPPQPQATAPNEPDRTEDAPRRNTPVQPKPTPTPEPDNYDDGIRKLIKRVWNYSATDAFKAIEPNNAADDDNLEAQVFGLWLTERGTWADVQPAADEKTSYGLVMKDADKERGKRMCVSGTILQIRVEKTELWTETLGLLISQANIFRFVAVQDTGDLVANSTAKFCGFVAGKTAFSNVSGGETQGVYIVGMFDLPSNRALKHKP